MKIDRRTFLLGGCCSAHLGLSPVWAQDATPSFICATLEPARDDEPDPLAQQAPREAADDKKQGETAAKATPSLTPYGVAFFNQRWRKQHGLTPNTGVITLGVHFMDGAPHQREAVRRHASEWMTGSLGQVLAFEFDVPKHRSQIRVSFSPGEGNWSYVGRQNRDISPSQKTMNIESLSRRVICHEFGHACGLQHEHHHPDSGIVWRETAVIADMAAQGWTEQQTRSNILTKYSREAACIGDPNFNRASIMIYPIPAHWTANGFSVGQVDTISNRDKACALSLFS
jgi:hypothetical protein